MIVSRVRTRLSKYLLDGLMVMLEFSVETGVPWSSVQLVYSASLLFIIYVHQQLIIAHAT